MRYITLVCLFLLALAGIAPSFAIKLQSLYEVSIPVASQSVEERNKASQQGLEQVFIKISADADVLNKPGIKNALTQADKYIQEYSYEASNNPAVAYLLKIRFDRDSIYPLLKVAGEAAWGDNRPLILVWLVTAAPSQPAEILSSESSDNINRLLRQQAERYGLPVILPVMDITDLNLVSAHAISTMSAPALSQASKRYSPDAILMGQWLVGTNPIQSEWRLALGGTEWNWKISGANPQEVVATLMSNISHDLAKHYAMRPASQKATAIAVVMQVNGIMQSDDLTSLSQMIKQIPAVSHVQLLEVTGAGISMQISLRDSLDNFQQNIALNPHLALQSKDTENSTLIYNWVQ